MNVKMRAGIYAGAATLAMTGVGFAGTANDAESQDLKQRLAAAEAKIAELEAASGDQWLTEQRASEIRSLVQDVLADADTRASMLQGMGAGYDNGFWVASSDGHYSLKINAGVQARFVWNFQDNDTGGADRYRYGFENTLTRLRFSGSAINPAWSYAIQGNFDRSGGEFDLEDGYVKWDPGQDWFWDASGWSMQIGQYKAPFLREELVDELQQQFVETSVVMNIFTADRIQGIMLNYTGDSIRGHATFHDGFNSDNTPWSMEDTEFAFGGRLEWKMGDDWARFDDFQSWRGDESFALLIGGAANWQRGEYGTGAGTGTTFNDFETDLFSLTADATLEFGGGFSIFGAFIYQTAEVNSSPEVLGTVVSDLDQLAFVIQGGLFLTDDFEIMARYEWADFDVSTLEDLNILTIGCAKYFARNNAKWQADVGFGFDEVAVAPDITGFRGDPEDQDGQIVFRTQFQLAF
jgi:hypothetical protein